ncbi:LacI family DNA-binding transcriptional regulator [candidate division KSB3 bacterium]|jgi:LacI family transcriptional regulator|nr:LacI family DNA-binding transcriptional regulator [candidate division KSB3 bacterium]
MSTITDVAELANVSIATVSRVLNGSAYVSPELEARVQKAIEQLGYRPNVLARHLRRNENPTIGILIPNSKNPFFAEMAKGIEDYCFDQGFVAVLCDTNDQPSKAIGHLELLYQQRAAGFVVVSPGRITARLQELLDHGNQIVVVDRALSTLPTDSVVSDNYGGGRQAVEHLLSLGHRRIGFVISNLEHETIQGRWAGAQDAMRSAGVPIDPLLVYTAGDELPGTGYEGAKYILQQTDKPTALFAFNDLMAFGVLRFAYEQGIPVPQHLSVIGFDDMMMANYSTPSLTTICQPKYELGQNAAEILLRRIQGDDLPRQKLKLTTELVIRESTTAPEDLRD